MHLNGISDQNWGHHLETEHGHQHVAVCQVSFLRTWMDWMMSCLPAFSIVSLVYSFWLTLWLFNVAMENGPFIDGVPIKKCDFPWLCKLIQMIFVRTFQLPSSRTRDVDLHPWCVRCEESSSAKRCPPFNVSLPAADAWRVTFSPRCWSLVSITFP